MTDQQPATTLGSRAAYDAAHAAFNVELEGVTNTTGERSRAQLEALGQAKIAYFEAFAALIDDMGEEGRVVLAYASAASTAVSYINQAAYLSHEGMNGFSWWTAQKVAQLSEQIDIWQKAEAAFAAAGYKPVEQTVISDSVGISGVTTRKIAVPIYNLVLQKRGEGEAPVFYAPTALERLGAIATRLRTQPAATGETKD